MKKRFFFSVAVAFIVIVAQNSFLSRGAVFFGGTPKNTAPQTEIAVQAQDSSIPALVTRVVDGDTIIVSIDGIEERVRLIGVDTPEIVDTRVLAQCFGKEASDFTKATLTGKQVILESDPSQSNRDKYGRLLRYVFLNDGTLVNILLITEGYGYEYTYDTPYQYQKEFKQAQATAKELKKGLWADGICNAK